MFDEVPDPLPGFLGLKIPEGAIQGVTGGAGRHALLKRLPVHAALNGCLHGLDSRQCSLWCLAITGIGNTFAAPGQAVATYLRHNHDSFCFGPTADGETAGNGPALDVGVELNGHSYH